MSRDRASLPELILASSSAYRRALLQRLGVSFRCIAPQIDESPTQALPLDPAKIAQRLAVQKAQSIARHHPKATVIGSDQLAVFEGTCLGKPGSPENAVAQLQTLSGKSHHLLTAVAIAHADQTETFLDRTTLVMRTLNREEIERYLAADEPWDCAGSYKIEAAGIALFDHIDTDDFTAITGLPLMRLTTHLRRLGYLIP